jgi:hypothetical protein
MKMVCFLIASDWHCEEQVKKGDTSGKNEYTLKIAEERIERFFQGGVRLYDIMARDTRIPTIVLGLLGDFISGSIHEELVEINQLLPADAIRFAQIQIIRGIKFLLANTPKDVEILVVCHSGNHGRMTKKQRHASENGNSLEAFMYRNIMEGISPEVADRRGVPLLRAPLERQVRRPHAPRTRHQLWRRCGRYHDPGAQEDRSVEQG